MVRVDAEVHLRTVVRFEPPRVVRLHVGGLQPPVSEDVGQEGGLVLDDVGRDTEVDVVKTRHRTILNAGDHPRRGGHRSQLSRSRHNAYSRSSPYALSAWITSRSMMMVAIAAGQYDVKIQKKARIACTIAARIPTQRAHCIRANTQSPATKITAPTAT